MIVVKMTRGIKRTLYRSLSRDPLFFLQFVEVASSVITAGAMDKSKCKGAGLRKGATRRKKKLLTDTKTTGCVDEFLIG